MQAVSTIIRFAVYGFVGLFGGLILGVVTAMSLGVRGPAEQGPVILTGLGVGLLIGLAMAVGRKS